jgi:DNA uptake protein ComE-like DNA-binding protein
LGLLLHLRTAEQQHVAASIDHSETPLQKPADPLIPSAQPQTGDTRVSVNTASQMELEELPYIGTKKASQIIERRPYRTIEEFFSKNTFSEKQVVELRNVLNL